jgi:hypothetical protein
VLRLNGRLFNVDGQGESALHLPLQVAVDQGQ